MTLMCLIKLLNLFTCQSNFLSFDRGKIAVHELDYANFRELDF